MLRHLEMHYSIMDTLSIASIFLEKLHFTSDELATIRTIGEYRGKQNLYDKQSPEVLENLRIVAKIESRDCCKLPISAFSLPNIVLTYAQ